MLDVLTLLRAVWTLKCFYLGSEFFSRILSRLILSDNKTGWRPYMESLEVKKKQLAGKRGLWKNVSEKKKKLAVIVEFVNKQQFLS
jgi:hypothetical protein